MVPSVVLPTSGGRAPAPSRSIGAHAGQGLEIAHALRERASRLVAARRHVEWRPGGGRDACRRPQVASLADQLGHACHRPLRILVAPGAGGPCRPHEQGLPTRGAGLELPEHAPCLLGHERHDRVEQAEEVAEELGRGQPGAGAVGIRRVRAPQVHLGHLEEPVAVVAPGDLVRHRHVFGGRVVVERPCRALDRAGETRAHPALGERRLATWLGERLRPRADHEPGRVPELRREVASAVELRPGEALVDAGGVARHERHAERIGADLADHRERVDDVALRLAHLLRRTGRGRCRAGTTVWNGSTSVRNRPSIIIRATQKKRISYAVSITEVG